MNHAPSVIAAAMIAALRKKRGHDHASPAAGAGSAEPVDEACF